MSWLHPASLTMTDERGERTWHLYREHDIHMYIYRSGIYDMIYIVFIWKQTISEIPLCFMEKKDVYIYLF